MTSPSVELVTLSKPSQTKSAKQQPVQKGKMGAHEVSFSEKVDREMLCDVLAVLFLLSALFVAAIALPCGRESLNLFKRVVSITSGIGIGVSLSIVAGLLLEAIDRKKPFVPASPIHPRVIIIVA